MCDTELSIELGSSNPLCMSFPVIFTVMSTVASTACQEGRWMLLSKCSVKFVMLIVLFSMRFFGRVSSPHKTPIPCTPASPLQCLYQATSIAFMYSIWR